MVRKRLLALLTLPIFTATAHASPPENIRFDQDDWELACDNTRTCRAAAYSAEDEDLSASVLFTRAAGPGTPVRAQLQLGHYQEPTPALPLTLQMRIDERNLGKVKLDPNTAIAELSPAQTSALLAAARKDSEIMWSAGGKSWSMSTKGANAVLSKMDAFQGRLDTPGALVRKGSKSETAVLPALPVPEMRVPTVAAFNADQSLLSAQHKHILLADLRRTVTDKDCDQFADIASGKNPLSVYRLSTDKLLVSATCWQFVYNKGEAYWIINEHLPFLPVLVVSDASDYQSGTIRSKYKMRSPGDCLSLKEWTWDGKRFVLTSESRTGMCHMLAVGGAWDLPTLVTKISRVK